MNPSPSFSISQAEILSVLRGFGIAELGAVLAVASVTVASGNFDLHVFLIAEAGVISSTAVNFLRKYLPQSQS